MAARAHGSLPIRGGRAGAFAITRSVVVDLVAGRRDHVPLAAELIEALPVRVAGRLVARVGVERVAVVGRDPLAVARRGRADLAGQGAALRERWLARRAHRGPDAQARRVAV